MKRIIATSLVLVFAFGFLILPALHKLYCADNHEAHETSNCTICQIANTAIITTAVNNELVLDSFVVDIVNLKNINFVSSSLRNPDQARAPPSC